MSDTINIFWPGDYRAMPNQTALPMLEAATAELEKSLSRLGRKHRRVGGFMTKPTRRSTKLGPIDDPMVGVFVHWAYAPHTVDGVVGKDNPLLLASQLLGHLARPGRPAQHRRLPRERGPRASRLWTDAADWTRRPPFMDALGRMVLDRPHRLRRVGRPRGPRASAAAAALAGRCMRRSAAGGRSP